MKNYDLYAIGNALVDSEYEVSEDQLLAAAVAKRHMTLIDEARREQLLNFLGDKHARRTGGGSAGNTVVALAQLGGRAFYSCRVADDALGHFYAHDLANHGVDSNLADTLTPPFSSGTTGTCIVLITPDTERSMNTYLGATADLDAQALRKDAITRSKVFYMEGYLAASPTGLAAAMQGREIAQSAKVPLALTLSDMSMINFCKPGLDAMLGEGVDYLFANEEEAHVWTGAPDFDAVCQRMAPAAKRVCITRGAKGCVVLEQGQRYAMPAPPIKALDTNGAGDMFAGAFLYAHTQGHSIHQAAWLANHAAARVVAQFGNRLSGAAITELKSSFAAYLTA